MQQFSFAVELGTTVMIHGGLLLMLPFRLRSYRIILTVLPSYPAPPGFAGVCAESRRQQWSEVMDRCGRREHVRGRGLDSTRIDRQFGDCSL